MLTIETGVRIESNSSDLTPHWKIVRKFSSQHLQIEARSLSELSERSEAARKEFGRKIELSFHLFEKEITGLFYRSPESIFRIAQEFEAKYIVMPLDVFLSNNQAPAASSPLFSNILRYAEEAHVFLCLEANIERNTNLKDLMQVFVSIKRAFSSWFLLFSVSVVDLAAVPQLNSNIAAMNNLIGIVVVNSDLAHLHSADDHSHFAELIGQLFWLPFKQRPLIFKCPVQSATNVYEEFYAIVENFGYEYV